jgi:hypothetical protein
MEKLQYIPEDVSSTNDELCNLRDSIVSGLRISEESSNGITYLIGCYSISERDLQCFIDSQGDIDMNITQFMDEVYNKNIEYIERLEHFIKQ